MVAGLAGIPRISTVAPQAGMFMLVDVRGTGLSGYEFMQALYKSQRVSVLDGAAFGRETAGFVRVCFATDPTSLDSGCGRIRRFCEQL
jgi:aspartate/methionine/tyrosine aminotransferase